MFVVRKVRSAKLSQSHRCCRYEKLTQDNKIATTEKSTAVKYKTKDQKETEAALVGLKEDREGTQKELDAILECATHCFDDGVARHIAFPTGRILEQLC